MEISSATDLSEELSALLESYRSSLAVIPVSRCPWTGGLWRRRMDISGLDGLWWDYEAPVRIAERVPETFVALTGSLRPADAVEEFPFLCKPGPEVPYVIPYLLRQDGMKAVMSRIQIGAHEGTAIAYFSSGRTSGFRVPNEWGSSRSVFIASDGGLVTTQDRFDESEFDFELRPYLDEELLLWIDPDDEELELRSGVVDCPFLDRAGRRSCLLISRGEIWTSAEPPEVGDSLQEFPELELPDLGEISVTESFSEADNPGSEVSVVSCARCGGEIRADAKFCGHCGASLEEKRTEPHCPSCGEAVSPTAKFCGVCGARITPS